MLQYSRRCSSIARLHELGRTVEGRPILALELSKSAGREDGKPHFKYVGNVHGDEPTGRVLTLALAEHICETYGADNTIRRLVEDLHLWLVPSMNPDGFKARTRANRSASLRPAGRLGFVSGWLITGTSVEHPNAQTLTQFTHLKLLQSQYRSE